MKKAFIFIGVLGLFYASHALHAQVFYKWKAQAALGTSIYKGDIGNSGKLKTAFSAGLQREIAYGIGARAGFERYTVTANDRVNASNELTEDADNFSRSLNFKTKAYNVSLQAVYSANNGYLLPENARIAPFAFAGAGITGFEIWADQYYGPGSIYPYDYANLDGNIRNVTSGDPKMQDGVFETNVTSLPLEETQPANTVFTPMLGLGANIRISNRFSGFVSSNIAFPFTDYLDGVSGKVNPALEPTSTEAYLANPGGLLSEYRGNPGKQDRIISASFGISYHFGGNYYDKGPVVLAPPQDTVKGKKAKKTENFEIDPFNDNAIVSGKSKRPFTLKEKEEMVFFTNENGERDTMFVMKIDTIYKNESYAVRGTETAAPKEYQSLTNNSGAPAAGADATVIRDIYEKLSQLTEGIAAIDNRVKQIENTLSNSSVRTYPSPVAESNTDIFSTLQSVVVYFPYGKSSLDAASTTKLNTIAEILKQYPNIGVALNAFADPSGSASTNMKLSQERASSVRKYLSGLGVKSYQMIAQYHGSEGDAGSADAGRRRVELEFIKVR
ncbi:MAG: OmpA family protein [Bacteroidia bacterium]|nr:OmpA family protein [Bacteroidia bacterium]